MNDYEFKPLSLDYLDLIAPIEQAAHLSPWSKNSLSKSLQDPNHKAWLLKKDQQVIGYMFVMTVIDQWELLNIVVSPDYQKQGWGKVLMASLLDEAKKHQIQTLFLEVRRSNNAAIALYLAHDFFEVGVRKNYYPTKTGREDALLMQYSF